MDKREDMTSGTEYGWWHNICQKYMQEQRAKDLKVQNPLAWKKRYNQVRAQIKERLQQEMEDFCADYVDLFNEARKHGES